MLLQQLSDLGHGIHFNQLPEEIVERTKHCLLDWIGVAIAGSRELVAIHVAEYNRAQGGRRQTSLIGIRARASTVQTVLANAVSGHALDYDDVHLAMWGHPSATVIPAALALAEEHHVAGRDLVAAIVAGVEIACLLGEAMTESHYRAGWHATATLGIFGAAAAAAHILGLSESQWAQALALAASQASGLQVLFGTEIKSYQVGKAASGGVEAALLAAKGVMGRTDIIECPRGFAEMYSGQKKASDCPNAGHWHVGAVLFKYHASCFGTHAAAEATHQLREKHSLSTEALNRLEIYVPPRYLQICNIIEPRTPIEAKFSLSFVCALALAGKQTGAIDSYKEELIYDPIIQNIMAKITVAGDSDLPDAGARVIARLKNSKGLMEHSAVVDLSRPEIDYRHQGERLQEKFLALTGPILGDLQAKKVIRRVMAMETLKDVSVLARSLA